jgi:hypothetical protein
MRRGALAAACSTPWKLIIKGLTLLELVSGSDFFARHRIAVFDACQEMNCSS